MGHRVEIIDSYLGKLCTSRPNVLHCDIRNGLFCNIPGPLPLVSFPYNRFLSWKVVHIQTQFHCDIRNGLFCNIPGPLPLGSFPLNAYLAGLACSPAIGQGERTTVRGGGWELRLGAVLERAVRTGRPRKSDFGGFTVLSW
ncbi:hypothetical protein NDU88_008494 [Pleurodeles waltl]|uniref:Uncharacterized protein n=1 Tax=Pleurodeles waltl TaxID=8319 RepID=A0AAV7NW78_PLEWA|nr:hypothetical protein NDU88_008494 [Pleurodeles waltl]